MLPRFHFSIERWRKNTEYGVWVSNYGRVRLIKNKKFLEPRINARGYCIYFTERGAIMGHRLVAYTWMGGKRNEKYTIDHINSNKRDNSVKNLRWVTEEINQAYASFTLCDSELKETKPQVAIEQDEDIIKNVNAKKTDRAAALKRLMENNKVALEIYTQDGKLCATCNSFPDARHYLTMEAKIKYNGNQQQFNDHIVTAIAMNKPVLSYIWKVKNLENNLEDINGN